MYTYITSFNPRNLKPENKTKKLYHCFESQSISILGIIDHKIVHNDNNGGGTVYKQVHSGLFITSPACRNYINAAVGGVGFMVNKIAANVLSGLINWNERIIIANFAGNPKTTIIEHHSPVDGNGESEENYNQLSLGIIQVPKHSVLIALRGFNAIWTKMWQNTVTMKTATQMENLLSTLFKSLTNSMLVHILKRNSQNSLLITLV